MSLPSDINPQLLASSTGYNLTRSLRFRSSASAYLNRTYVASPTDYRKYTFSAWVKLGALGVSRRLIDAGSGSDTGLLNINSDGTLEFTTVVSGSGTTYLKTNNVLRDPSAWYHIVFSCDTSVGSNQFKFYVNNVQASYSTNTAITINYGTYLNSGSAVAQLGRSLTYGQYFDGYLTEVNFIDGQALTPSSFGSTNTLTGVWQPARYAGTYGTNGGYWPFTDNSALTTSSNVGLGKDFSGNGNYWTTNNISITAGTTYDSMTDVPTLTSATAANFAVLNPLASSVFTYAEANLAVTNYSAGASFIATIGVSSGKWYWEYIAAGTNSMSGINQGNTSTYPGGDSVGWGYLASSGDKYNNGANSAYGSSYVAGDVIGTALDLTAGTITMYKNNVSQGVMASGLSGTYFPAFRSHTTGTVYVNFGQRPFSYTPPTGYVALNTYNLPTSTIVKGNTVMDATLYTGDGTSPRSITNAAGFKPDFVWIKKRSAADGHILNNSVMGVGAGVSLYSNQTSVAGTFDQYGYLNAFNSNGFSTQSGSTDSLLVNANAATYVGWQWQAGQGTNTTNTSGSITSTVSVNASAGFSVVTYTANGTTATIGHGLGVTPQFIVVKARSSAQRWTVFHTSTSNAYIYLNETFAAETVNAANRFGNNSAVVQPTSSVFTIGNSTDVNSSGNTYVAYCWTPIAGYSAFGSYNGSGSADGPFIYTGFQPKWIVVKASSTTSHWFLWDAARNTYNVTNNILYPNLSAAETPFSIDILSNGFKFRESGGAGNDSGVTYIYAAFATSPFKNSLAR